MKALKRALKTLIITVLAYLIQACVMKYLPFRGVNGSVVFAALAIIIVSCGKKYAFCASCLIGMMMESMLANVPALYAIAYPVITMFSAQYFADMTDRQLERRRMRAESKQLAISEGKGKEHWWRHFLPGSRETDLPPAGRIPLCAGIMDLVMNIVLIVYLYLIGEEWNLASFGRGLLSALYTAVLAILLMAPCRYLLGMYRRRKRIEGGELL